MNDILLIDHQQFKPDLKGLVRYSGKIVTCWKRLALELSLSAEVVDTINANHVDVNDKCYDMFNTWLRQTCDPCWCQVVRAFKMVQLLAAAREIENKFGKKINCVSYVCRHVYFTNRILISSS